MSYLLDALNKSRGETPVGPSEYGAQPQVLYAPGPQSRSEGNIYKWISIVLALILTLIVGIFVGNRYAVFSAPQTATGQAVATSTEPQTQAQTTQTQPPVAAQNDAAQQTAQTDKAIGKANKTPASNDVESKPTNEQTQLAQQESQSEPQEQEQIIVGAEPRNRVKQLSANEANVSSELLKRFNQAIAQSEGVEQSFEPTTAPEYALEEYLTRVPEISELEYADQLKIPGFTYDTHLYASEPAKRQVKLNGVFFNEKEWISELVQIQEIQRQFLILEMGHLRFSVPALTDWQEVTP